MAGGDKPLTYGSYLNVPELLELQDCRSDPAHHDELQFIIVHQAYELWFKLQLHTLEAVRGAIDADEPRRAVFLMDRVLAIQRHLLDQIHILETMDPLEFTRFRDELMPASGFQSYQFRELTFLGGLKDERFLHVFDTEPHARERLDRRLAEPSLWDRFTAAMERAGLPMPAGEEGRQKRLDSLETLYEEATERFDLYQLAERLIAWDEMFRLWRHHHVMMVERMIGFKRGTGGSEGAAYLRRTLDERFFPDLWTVRTQLGDEKESYGSGPSPLDLEEVD